MFRGLCQIWKKFLKFYSSTRAAVLGSTLLPRMGICYKIIQKIGS